VLLVIVWPDYKTNTDIEKKLNTTPVLDKMQDYRRNWLQYVNRTPCNGLLKIIKKTADQKAEGRRNQEETIDKTTECIRQEQVNKWPKSMIAR
jgi:hypothetical protein